jgi:hypothetical protein
MEKRREITEWPGVGKRSSLLKPWMGNRREGGREEKE